MKKHIRHQRIQSEKSFIAAILFTLFFITISSVSAKTVVDQLGRTVHVPENPTRIVALAPSITEIVFALEEGRRLAGITRFSNFPEAAMALPRVGSYVHLDIEKIVSLKPDLCIAVKDGNPKTVIDKLEMMNIPVYAVDPRNLVSVMDSLAEIGRLISAEKKAAELIAEMAARINKIKNRIKKADHVPRVFFQIGISPIVSVGTDTFLHELIVMAGGENVSKGPVPYPRFSREQIIVLSPDIFIITSMARGEIFERVKAGWSKWKNIPAVKNDRILLVDSDILDRASPRLVDGYELLARLIHPELFKPGWEEE